MNFKSLLLKKLNKFILIMLLLFIVMCIASPYLVIWYTKKKYNNLINFMQKSIPGIKITNYNKLGYLKSLLLSKIELPSNFLWIDPNSNSNYGIAENTKDVDNNYLSKHIVTLQHKISYTPHKKSLATIDTKVLIGLPKFIKDLNLITVIDFKGNITTTIKDIDFNYILPLANNKFKSLLAEKVSIDFNNDNKNLYIDFKFPKIIYKEYENILDIDNLQLNVKLKDFTELNKRRIKFLTEIDKLYLVSQNTTILRLANFSMEQRLSDRITNNLSFFKLNILDQSFGPLVTKLKLHNLNFSKLVTHFKYLKLPFSQEQLKPYKIIESFNQLFQYKPSISLDLLLNLGEDKLKFLSDAMLDSRNSEWFNKEDFLNSVTANIFAHIPKVMMLDLISKLVEHQQSKKLIHLEAQHINSDPKKLLSYELENLILAKMQYLLKNNIIKEEADGFVVNLSIAEGTFFSKNNPFKLFSF